MNTPQLKALFNKKVIGKKSSKIVLKIKKEKKNFEIINHSVRSINNNLKKYILLLFFIYFT